MLTALRSRRSDRFYCKVPELQFGNARQSLRQGFGGSLPESSLAARKRPCPAAWTGAGLDRRRSDVAGSFPMAQPRWPTLPISLPDQLRNLAEGALGRPGSPDGVARVLFHDQWQYRREGDLRTATRS